MQRFIFTSLIQILFCIFAGVQNKYGKRDPISENSENNRLADKERRVENRREAAFPAHYQP